MSARTRSGAAILAVAIVLAGAGRARAQDVAAAPETIAEVRVHGNASIPDADVLRLAGIVLGGALEVNGIEAIERRLRESRRFESVEVRKRYRSLTDLSSVALVILVHERPSALRGALLSRPFRQFGRDAMFLPILGYTEGYGLSYGVRIGTKDLLGGGERLSVPLTWGGTRRAALEAERPIRRGPIDRVEGSFGIASRENPRFNLDDTRLDVRARGERRLPGGVRLGAEIGRSRVSFGDLDDRLWTFTGDARLDTRNDPAFPRRGVLARVSWTALNLPGRGVRQYRADLRAFQPLFGQVVLAVRGAYTGSDGALPPYERLLLGGGSSLRGYRVGSFDGDRLATASAELRVPLTSVIGGGRLGVTIFGDAGAAYNHDESLSHVPFHRGFGGGAFMSLAVFSVNLDVARNDEGHARAHLAFGFSF